MIAGMVAGMMKFLSFLKLEMSTARSERIGEEEWRWEQRLFKSHRPYLCSKSRDREATSSGRLGLKRQDRGSRSKGTLEGTLDLMLGTRRLVKRESCREGCSKKEAEREKSWRVEDQIHGDGGVEALRWLRESFAMMAWRSKGESRTITCSREEWVDERGMLNVMAFTMKKYQGRNLSAGEV